MHTIHPDGSALTAIAVRVAGGFTDVRAPGWSPHCSRTLCRLYLGAEHRADLYTLDPARAEPSRVTTSGDVDTPGWGTAAT